MPKQIKVNNFAFYKGQAVAVNTILDDQVSVTYIASQYVERNGEEVEVKGKKEVVPLNKLVPFSHKAANALISEYNLRIHAINECLRYA